MTGPGPTLAETSLPRWRAVVLALQVALGLVQIGRVAILGSPCYAIAAIVPAALVLAPHLRHVDAAMRDRRARHGLLSLGFMLAVTVVSVWLIGSVWVFLFAPVAVSAIIVLGARAAAVVVSLGVSAVAAAALRHGVSVADTEFGSRWYVAYTFAFQTALIGLAVALVAAADRLARTAPGLAAARSSRERALLLARIDEQLTTPLDDVALAANAVADAALRPGRLDAGVAAAIDTVIALTDDTLQRTRETVARSRTAMLTPTPAQRTPPADALPTRALRLAVAAGYLLITVIAPLKIVAAGGPGLVAAWATGLWLTGTATAGWASWRAAAGRRVAHVAIVVPLNLAALIAGRLWLGGNWIAMAWPTAVLLVLVLTGRWRWTAATTMIAAVGADEYVQASGSSPFYRCYVVFYLVVLSVEAVVALLGASWLLHAVDALASSREEIANAAADQQRLRVSTQLHDLLGQTLTAISLKGDLARRLLDRDPARARAEIGELAALATRQRDELERVLHGDVVINLPSEVHRAHQLLRSAGAEADIKVQPPHEPAVQALAAWAVREAITNIVRHSGARTVSITATTIDDRWELDVINDGVPTGAPSHTAGTGLDGLGRRIHAAGGTLEAGPDGDGRYRLHIRLPSSPQTITAGNT